ncbi:phosphatidylserine/phosphatidylglycerophosphate/cardiolipin synthase family protein [Glycomyces sp. NPDC048151]|uniref:phospholipase D-like domain-containing protein n=1 Tax=Glycomyces sp. NPDC048151 TaxID=3364002 RepID=UPI003717BC9E
MNRRILAVVAAGVLLVALTASVATEADAAATGCGRTGSFTVCTTNPNGTKDTAIVNEITKQVQATGDGDTIRLAVYYFSLDKQVAPLADALVAAKKRGVDVKAVFGTRSDKPSLNDAVIAKLKSAGAAVRQCSAGCLPNADGTRKGPMHNRFFLIEKGGSPTVLVTSLSFVGSQLTQAHNLLGVHGDQAVYDFYNAYWNRLYAKSWDGWTDANKGRTGSLAKAWVFPRSADPVAAELAQITACHDGDRVWVGHANFQSNRPETRAQLDRIQGLGCQVRVVVRTGPTASPGWIEDKLGSSNVRVHDAHRNKYLVAEAQFGSTHRAVVWTGTHNLNGNGLKHSDDNMMRVMNQSVADRYLEHFQALWNGAD